MSPRDRYLLISADCHAGPRADVARGYVDAKHRAAFDAWLADEQGMARRRAEHTGEAIYGDEALADFSAEESTSDLDLRLFRGDTEIEPEPGPFGLFPMPPERATYRLTGQGPQTDVTWTFGSKEPVQDTRRDGYMCFLEMAMGSRAPCAPVPIVYVSYDMADSLAMDNSVRAPGAQRFVVHAYHARPTGRCPRSPSAPRSDRRSGPAEGRAGSARPPGWAASGPSARTVGSRRRRPARR